MLNLTGFLLSAAILYWIFRYRVHVYVVTQPRGPRPTPAMAQRVMQPDPRRDVLADTLVGLGAKRRAALGAADRAIAANPQGTVEALIGAAIREVTGVRDAA